MYCKNCGSQLKDGDKFCQNCGVAIGDSPMENISNDTNLNQEEISNEPVETNAEVNATPVYNQPVNNEAVPAKKSNALFIVIIVILVFAVGGLILYIVLKDEPKPNNPVPNNPAPNSVETTKTLKYGGYEFVVPAGFEISEKDGYTGFSNSEMVILINQIIDSPYETVKAINLNTLKSKLETNSGMRVTAYDYRTIGSKELIYFYGSLDGTNVAVILSALDENNTIEFDCALNNNSLDSVLTKSLEIINSAKKA